jgi:hypothetical protein
MIESVDRIVTTPISECPALVEAVVPGNGAIVKTFWATVEPRDDGLYRATDVDTGDAMVVSANTMVKWLKPEDMNDPVIQAELIAGLAQMGIEL